MLDSHSITSEEGKREGVNSHYCNSTEECFKKATNEVNNLIHEESNRIIENDVQMPFDIASFDADIFISQVNPTLWTFITDITQCKVDTTMTHDKKLTCIYCLCMLMFSMNRQCSIPLHVLLTDIVDSCGGSKELIQILNKFGAIASTDTHKRYIQYQINKRLQEGLTSNLQKNALRLCLWTTLISYKAQL